jgi:hypothetical protein
MRLTPEGIAELVRLRAAAQNCRRVEGPRARYRCAVTAAERDRLRKLIDAAVRARLESDGGGVPLGGAALSISDQRHDPMTIGRYLPSIILFVLAGLVIALIFMR